MFIYDKATGMTVAGFTENSLFSGGPTGTLCDTNSFGRSGGGLRPTWLTAGS
jgi:hypothetical protein